MNTETPKHEHLQPLFVFTADNHLKQFIWNSMPHIEGDTYANFNEVVNYAIANKLPLVLGGDVFDVPNPTTQTLEFMGSVLSRLNNADIPLLWLDGNHDKSTPSWCETFSKLTRYSNLVDLNAKQVYQLNKLSIAGIPYHPDESALARYCKEIKADVLVSHQLVNILTGDMIANVKAESYSAPENSCVLLGDFHQPVDTVALGGALFAYSGSTTLMSISEPVAKSFIVLYRNTKTNSFVIQRVPIQTRIIRKIRVDSESELNQLKQVCDQLVEQPHRATPLLIVKYADSVVNLGSNLRELAGKYANKLFWIIRSEMAARLNLEDKVQEEKSVDELLAEFIDSKTESDIFKAAKSLIGRPTDIDVATRFIGEQ